MTAPATTPLRTLHRVTLGALAVCAAAVALQTASEPEPPPDRNLTVQVVVLAFVTVVGRLMARSPVASSGLRRICGFASLAAALGIGLISVELAVRDGAVHTGLLFTGGAFILALRPPFAPEPPSRDNRDRGDRGDRRDGGDGGDGSDGVT